MILSKDLIILVLFTILAVIPLIVSYSDIQPYHSGHFGFSLGSQSTQWKRSSETEEEKLQKEYEKLNPDSPIPYQKHPVKNYEKGKLKYSSSPKYNHHRIALEQKTTYFRTNLVNGHYFLLHNPMHHFSFYQPESGCGSAATVPKTSLKHKCKVSTNAGFFNKQTYQCYGNIIEDGFIVQESDLLNANFGITKNGQYVIGYLTKAQIEKLDFEQLISGVIWLVKEGKNHVAISEKIENLNTQESGPTFVTLSAGRNAIGFTESGELILLQADGDGPHDLGVDLYQLADELIKLGAYGAINLDGGGSSTTVINGEIVNAVSDGCPMKPEFHCPRPVSTITCIHDNNYVPHELMEKRIVMNVIAAIIFIGVFIITLLIFAIIVILYIYRNTDDSEYKDLPQSESHYEMNEVDNHDRNFEDTRVAQRIEQLRLESEES